MPSNMTDGVLWKRYPVWRDWFANPAGHRRRAAVIERLRTAGILELPSTELGW